MPSGHSESPPISSDSDAENNTLESSTAEDGSADTSASEGRILPEETAGSSSIEQSSASAQSPAPGLEELTVSELLALFMRSPVTTWRRLRYAADSPAPAPSSPMRMAGASPTVEAVPRTKLPLQAIVSRLAATKNLRLCFYALAILFAIMGSAFARGAPEISRTNEFSLNFAAPYLWSGFFLWLAADILGHLPQIKSHWRDCTRLERLRWAARIIPAAVIIGGLHLFARSMAAPPESAAGMALDGIIRGGGGLLLLLLIEWLSRLVLRVSQGSKVASQVGQPQILEQNWIVSRPARRLPIWKVISRLRLFMLLLAMVCSVIVWENTQANHIEPHVILLWLFTIAIWAFTLLPRDWNLFGWASDRLDARRRFNGAPKAPLLLAFALIMFLGIYFRLERLESFTPEMHADQSINIWDAYAIHTGLDKRIFLANNGGREPIHIYLIALLSSQPGRSFDRYTLYLTSAWQSILTLPIVFWLGFEVMRRRRREFALMFGLIAAGILAASYWHTMLARQGLRINLSVLFTALSAVYFLRAMRDNRRSDYILAGLTLGLGLSSYKSVRMLPLLYIAGLAITFWLRRRSRSEWMSRLFNFLILAFMSFVVFLPLIHYWQYDPHHFTHRVQLVFYGGLPEEGTNPLLFFLENASAFLSNIRNTLLMFYYTHQGSWAFSAPGEPAVDPVTGAFMALGAASWLTLLIKRRDPIYCFVPVFFLGMLLVAAFAISYPWAVPSTDWSSGALPAASLIAALPITLFCRQLVQTLPRRAGTVAALLFASLVILGAYQFNHNLYFGPYTENYRQTAKPQSQAGQVLRGFAESGGAFGNAFIVTSPHWWDHRAVGIEAGILFWENVAFLEDLPGLMANRLAYETDYPIDPARDLLFFYSQSNDSAPQQLAEWFPGGNSLMIDADLSAQSFYIYRVPALGEAGLQRFIEENT